MHIITITLCSIIIFLYLSKLYKKNRYNTNIFPFCCIMLLSLYSAFSIAGGNFFFPKNAIFHFSYMLLIKYLILSIICFIIFSAVMQRLNEFPRFSATNETKLFYLQSFYIILCIGLIYWILCYPGNISYDSWLTWVMIQNNKMGTAHTILYTVIQKFLFQIWYSPAIISLMQVISFAAIYSLWITFFYGIGISPKILLPVFVLFYALPINGTTMVTLWKDIPYTQSLILISYIFLQLFTDQNKQKNMYYLLISGIILSSAYLFRHNGIIVMALGLFILFIYSIIKKSWKIFTVPLAGVLISIIFVDVVLFRTFQFSGDLGANKSSLVLTPINTAYLYGQEDLLHPEIKKLASYLREDLWRTGQFNSMVHFYIQRNYNQENAQCFEQITEKIADNKTFFKHYIQLWTGSHMIHLRNRLNLIDVIWNRTPYPFYGLSPVTFDQLPGYPQGRAFPMLMEPLDRAVNTSYRWFPLWITTIILLFALTYEFLYGDKRKLIIYFPWFANAISLFLFSPSLDFRYFWIGIWMVPISLFLIITELKNK